MSLVFVVSMFSQFFGSGEYEFAERERESSKYFCLNNSCSRAQGTVEYLVIIAVVIVLSLVVVGLVLSQVDNSKQVSSSSNALGLASQVIGVTESLVSPTDGNFVVKLLNNSGEFITVSNVKVGDSNIKFSQDLAQGSSKLFKVSTLNVCELGKIISEDVIVTYVTVDGLTKTERYPAKVMFDCTPFTINQANLANQCPSCETCVDPVELHSGQTTSYDVGALDDKEQDGTAKSYTGDGCGGGTVLDNYTGLCWQKNHKDNCATLTWEAALNYCSTLANGSGGLTDGSVAGDWRVPSFVELSTLPDMSYPSSSYLNSVFTQTGWNSTCYGYWSSTTVPSNTSHAYYLRSVSGRIVYDVKTSGGNVGARCVRSGN